MDVSFVGTLLPTNFFLMKFTSYVYQRFIPQNWRGPLLAIAIKFMWHDQLELIKSKHHPVSTYLVNIKNKLEEAHPLPVCI